MGKLLKFLIDYIWVSLSLSAVFVLYMIKDSEHINLILILLCAVIYCILVYKLQVILLGIYTKLGTKNDTIKVLNNEIENASLICLPIYIGFCGLLVYVVNKDMIILVFIIATLLFTKIKYIYFSPFLYFKYNFYIVTSIKNQRYLLITTQKDIKTIESFTSLVRLNNFSFLEI